MKKSNLIILVAVLVLIVGAIYFLERPATIELESGEIVVLGSTDAKKSPADVGSVAPGFLLVDHFNQTIELSDFRGKKVLLNFWASWCPFCLEEMPLFQDFYDEFKAEGFVVIAINRGESLNQATNYTGEMGLTYTLLLDESDGVYGAYQGRAMPTTFLIDENGVILDRKFGPYSKPELREKLKRHFKLGLSEESDSAPTSSEPSSDESTEALAMVDEEVTSEPELATNEPEIMDPKAPDAGRPIEMSDGTKHSVPLEDIRGGGPPKDGIPSIDNPKFVSIEEADEYIKDDGLGIALSLGGVDRFYPNQILVWHEIVNDKLGDKSVLVTYCPLCGTGIVFDPIVKGKATEFGTSGKLWNSNLVMYDRQTDSYWSQVLGEAIVGEMTGTKLKLLPHDNVLYADWKKDFPNGEVLSRETGQIRDYNRDPYGNYYTSPGFFFPVDNEDDRYFEKEPTFGVEIDNQFKAYPQSELLKGSGEFTDRFAGVGLKITFDKERKTIDIRRADNNEEVVSTYGFWFSWISVHPDSEVWTAE